MSGDPHLLQIIEKTASAFNLIDSYLLLRFDLVPFELVGISGMISHEILIFLVSIFPEISRKPNASF